MYFNHIRVSLVQIDQAMHCSYLPWLPLRYANTVSYQIGFNYCLLIIKPKQNVNSQLQDHIYSNKWKFLHLICPNRIFLFNICLSFFLLMLFFIDCFSFLRYSSRPRKETHLQILLLLLLYCFYQRVSVS